MIACASMTAAGSSSNTIILTEWLGLELALGILDRLGDESHMLARFPPSAG